MLCTKSNSGLKLGKNVQFIESSIKHIIHCSIFQFLAPHCDDNNNGISSSDWIQRKKKEDLSPPHIGCKKTMKVRNRNGYFPLLIVENIPYF